MGSLKDKHETITGYDFRIDEPLTPLKAIREKCKECNCGSHAEIKLCEIYDCPLWPLRPGYRAKRSANLSPEQMEAKRKRGRDLASLRNC